MPAAKKKPSTTSAKKKAAAKKATAKKPAAAKKATAKKATAKKATAKKATAKKPAAKKATAKKATAKQATAKKATTKQATAKKATAKKATANKPSSSGGFALRSIQTIVEILRATRPDETLNAPTTHEHYDTIGAWSFDPVGQWASSPPFAVLYQQRNPLGYSKKVLDDPKSLVSYCNFGGSIATWNAKGRGQWLHEPRHWIIADIELVQEQAGDYDDYFDDEEGGSGNYVSLICALWKIEEGWAAAIWPSGDTATLAALIGLAAWPSEGWQPCEVWYGE